MNITVIYLYYSYFRKMISTIRKQWR